MKYHVQVFMTLCKNKNSYAELLDVFWQQIDPSDPGGQFVDRGAQYQSAIFVTIQVHLPNETKGTVHPYSLG